MTSCTVAICAYTEDRWTDLRSAVRSVEAQRGSPPDQVLVVIDHNEQLFTRATHELRSVEVVRSTGPKGLSGARNTAIERSTTDVIAFLDDDAAAAPDWLSTLLRHYGDPLVLGVGGLATPAWADGRPAWFPDEFLWVVGCSHRGLPTSVAAVRNLIGCNMSVRTEVLRQVGGFDVALGRTADRPLGCEETELCIRATELTPGGRFILDPAAVVTHRVPASRRSWPYFLARCRAEGVSKAWVADRVGAVSATATERDYVTHTLPSGLVRGLRDALSGDVSGMGRAAAIVAGLATTTASYALRRVRRQRNTTSAFTDDAGPLMTRVIDRSLATSPIEQSTTADGTPYSGVHCVVLDGSRPAGVVVVPFEQRVIAASTLLQAFQTVPTAAVREPTTATGEPISVVIATRDRPAMLERCVRSIQGGSVRPTRLVIVDNAPSTADAETTARRLADEFPEIVYVREDRPGLAIAHNRGLAVVDTPLVAFTDDDVVVGEHWLSELQSAFNSESGPACVTGSIVPLELDTATQRTIEAISGFNKGWEPMNFRLGDRQWGPLFPYAAGVFGSGANMSFRTSYLRAAGGFDEALGTGTLSLGGDDLAAFYDVIASGSCLRYEPAAIVRHAHHREPAALARQAHAYGAGLSAHLTRCVVRNPRALVDFGRCAVAGLRRANAISTPTARGSAGLRGATLRGMATGGPRYLTARIGAGVRRRSGKAGPQR